MIWCSWLPNMDGVYFSRRSACPPVRPGTCRMDEGVGKRDQNPTRNRNRSACRDALLARCRRRAARSNKLMERPRPSTLGCSARPLDRSTLHETTTTTTRRRRRRGKAAQSQSIPRGRARTPARHMGVALMPLLASLLSLRAALLLLVVVCCLDSRGCLAAAGTSAASPVY